MKMTPNFLGMLCLLLLPAALLGQTGEHTPAEACRFVTATDLSDAKAPAFGDYPTVPHEGISNSKLDLKTSPVARKYRTQLRQQIAAGPNYAGHYTVAFWGCGSSCTMFAVVNLKTGKVISASEFATVSGVNLAADDFLAGAGNDAWALRYKNNSTLLVVVGAPNEDESKTGAIYFVIQDEKLRLIHTTRVHKNCENVTR